MNTKGIVGAIAFVITATMSTGHAADITGEEINHLEQTFGLCRDGQMLKDMTPEERSRIHAISIDPWTRDYPETRDILIMGQLTGVYERECRGWEEANHAFTCPPAADPNLRPGKIVADNQCNACHLFGTADAPGFFRLAREGGLTTDRLADALDHGHRMSPIHLLSSQLNELRLYINSLSCPKA